MIEAMLAEDTDLAQRFAAKQTADPEFAADPWAIRYWFYEQTPFYDQQVGIYPVGMIDDADVARSLGR